MRMLGMMVLVVLGLALRSTAHDVALFDELMELYPDTDPADGSQRMALDTARGVPAGVHVLVSGLPAEADVTWRVVGDGQQVNRGRAFRLIDVPVEKNTGLVAWIEKEGEPQNPHVIREAPFCVFEALQPIGETAAAGDNGVLALRIEVPVRPGAKVGRRSYVIELASDGWTASLAWELTVHSATVAPINAYGPGFTNWFSPSEMASRQGVEAWSEEFWTVLGQYADVMARARQNTFWIRWGDFVSMVDGTPTLDLERFQRYVQTFLERGLAIIELGHVAGRHQGDWNSPRLDLTLTGSDANSEQGKRELAALLGAVRAALDGLKLPEGVEFYQHIADEPTDVNAESYQGIAKQVREHLPGVRILEATMSTALVGAVDVWCPQVQEYQRHRDFFQARKAEGEGVWIYTCLAPGGPWLNRLLDQERLRPVYIGWALAKYELDGFLHWGFNHYGHGIAGHDPFTQSVVAHPAGGFLPAGDTHVVYPGPDGPWSGQRLEAHRLGMEDAQLLQQLRLKNADAAQAIIGKVLRACDDYETDVTAYREAKRELLKAMSDAGR